MIYINNRIILAISSLKQICITDSATGDKLGITGKHVGQILKGEVESIRPSTWKQMEPVLQGFMPAEKLPNRVTENSTPYCTRSPRLRRLCDWLENEASTEQVDAVMATARAVGFLENATNSSHSGRAESPSTANAA